MKDFNGKVAVITGAGSGFGREFARIAAGLGMKLVLADIQEQALQAVAAEFPRYGNPSLCARMFPNKPIWKPWRRRVSSASAP